MPPKGYVSEEIVERARMLKIRGVDVVHIPEGPRGARMSALSLAVLIQQRAWIETVLEYSCRDRNLLGMQSDLLGAHAMGVRNLVLVTGDARPVGDYPDATAVFDVDSVGLTNVVARLNHGLDIGGQGIGSPTAFHVGVHVNPGAEDLEAEVRRFEYKVEAGAEYAITRPMFDLQTFERLYKRIDGARRADHRRAVAVRERAQRRVHGQRSAGRARARRGARSHAARGEGEGAAAEGIAIARELGAELKGAVQGVHIAAPSGRVEDALAVLAGIR